jgi:PhnB protein
VGWFAVPEGYGMNYRSVTPYLIVSDVPGLIGFVTRVFGAIELLRTPGASGGLHAEVNIGDSVVMMGQGPGQALMPAALYVYVEDADAAYRRALQAGATSQEEPTDTSYGDRRAGVLDPFGNRWFIATHKQDARSR